MSASPVSSARPLSRKIPVQWLPRQHGAWAMLFLPFLVGLSLRIQESRFNWMALPLLLLWLLGYFAFSALSLWLKSRRQAKYLQPIQVYGASCAVLGALVLWQQPGLFGWSVLFAPLLGLGLWRAAQQDDTSLLARWVNILAACLICAVVYSDSFAGFWAALAYPGPGRAGRATLILSGYFLGTVLYVKTMIRERGELGYLAASIGFHFTLTLLSLWAWTEHSVGWSIPVFFTLTTLRAGLMPWRVTQGEKISPKQVGILEFGLNLILLLMLTIR